MEVTENTNKTYDIRGKGPVKITFFDSDRVVWGDEVYENVKEFSVIVRDTFHSKECDYIVEQGNKLWVEGITKTDCEDAELTKKMN